MIQGARSGDEQAFELLVLRYRTALALYLGRYAMPHADAEDLIQETLIRVWRGLAKYRHEGRFRSWLFTIAHNVAVSHASRQEIRRTATLPETFAAPERTDALVSVAELRTVMRDAVEGLPEEQRDVFRLRQDAGLSYREIAELQGVTVSTALSRMHYAVQKLRRVLDDHGW